jgi:hypothetical protein
MDLGSLVAPLTLEEFLTGFLGRKAVLLPGSRDRFRELFDWKVLDRALNYHRLPAPRLRLARGGRILPPSSYRRSVADSLGVEHQVVDTGQLYRELRDGASLVLDAVEEFSDPVHRLVWHLERTLRERVSVNAYASWALNSAFDVHWDNHDVIVLQIAGHKEWTLLGSGRRWPLRTDIEENAAPSRTEAETVVMSPGDVLHVPRGCWHSVRASRPPSLHLAVGVTRSTGHDFVRWVADRLLSSELVRRDLPRCEGAEAQAAHVAALREEVLTRLTPEGLQEFFAFRDGTAHARPAVDLTRFGEDLAEEQRLEHTTRIEWLFPRAVLSEPDDVNQPITLTANGRIWRFQRAASPVLSQLLTQRETAFGALEATGDTPLDPKSLRDLITDLSRNGLVRIRPTASVTSLEDVPENHPHQALPE